MLLKSAFGALLSTYPPPIARFAVGALAAGLLAVSAVACGGGDDNQSAGPKLQDPGPVHVHGLGINPKDGALFIATHTGLFRAAPGEQESRRVADRYQDTMGFTVSGPDRFLGSGHPDLREAREGVPPLLGLIASKDAGESWQRISLLGEADFHVLEARGRRVYGFDSSNERLMVSVDGGENWSERRPPQPFLSLAIDPRDATHLFAAGEDGLYESGTEGRRWHRVRRGAGLLGWPAAGRLYLVGPDGRVEISDGSGSRWRRVGDIGGQPAAFEAEGPRELYAALHDGTVKRSGNGGESWRVRSRP